MEFAIRLFFAVFAGAFKRFVVPGLAVAAVIALITGISGGSWLMAGGITLGVELVVLVVASLSALQRPW